MAIGPDRNRVVMRPLWRILMVARRETLTCEECAAIIGYLADLGAAGVDGQLLLKAARSHLGQCPDCRKHYARHLRALEERLDDQSRAEG